MPADPIVDVHVDIPVFTPGEVTAINDGTFKAPPRFRLTISVQPEIKDKIEGLLASQLWWLQRCAEVEVVWKSKEV